ncbi:unnamed protein product [Protopolystoma xenopodis]|uniref:Uncharacterized protein n=1 Tax=Protopolystoma xenopodis TaxID=117903 RepID=A0A448WIA4_9PLAT|nr:unnamed protein product [Protopolystoma xenopodis]
MFGAEDSWSYWRRVADGTDIVTTKVKVHSTIAYDNTVLSAELTVRGGPPANADQGLETQIHWPDGRNDITIQLRG